MQSAAGVLGGGLRRRDHPGSFAPGLCHAQTGAGRSLCPFGQCPSLPGHGKGRADERRSAAPLPPGRKKLPGCVSLCHDPARLERIEEKKNAAGNFLRHFDFGLLFVLGFKLAMKQEKEFNALMITGLLGLIMVQVIINLGVVVSLIPVTGITLPLISYGGSSLSVCLCSLGLIVSRK